MNAMEHGNGYRPDALVVQHRRARPRRPTVSVRITDQGGDREMPEAPRRPDLDAKLDGRQSPRGWGLFLIEQHGRRGARSRATEHHHTLELDHAPEKEEDDAAGRS